MKSIIAIATIALIAVGTTGRASEREPAWKRIANKIARNSITESAPAEIPEEFRNDFGASESSSLIPPEGGTIGLPQVRERSRGRRGNTSDINFGKEYQETGSVRDLFTDAEVLRMLGDNPRFVYASINTPDPMIFPPVRNAAMYIELTYDAEALLEAGEFGKAVKLYRKVLALGDPRYSAEMRNKIAKLNAEIGASAVALEAPDLDDIQLPTWISDNTNGVLYTEDDPMCLIGDFLLHVGDELPNYPQVKVTRVGKQSVTFQVAGRKEFEIEVKGIEH